MAQKINVDKIKSGMQLAEPIVVNYTVLIPQNRVLNDHQIQKIKTWNINSIYIKRECKLITLNFE